MSAARSLSGQMRFLVMLQGVALVVAGLFFLIAPVQALTTMMLILGAYFVIHGLATLLYIAVDQTNWGWKIFVGAFSVIAGVMAMTMPALAGVGLLAFAFFFVAIQALVAGAVQFVVGIRESSLGMATLGLLVFLIGLVLVNYPMIGLIWAGVFLGAFATIGGLAAILFAIRKVEEPRTITAG